MEERWIEIHIIAKYKFDATIDTMPTFNEDYSLDSMSVYDTDNGDGTITRSLDSSVKPTSISFAGCTGLLEVTDITISGNSYIDLFNGCTNLTYVNMNNWINGHVTHTGSMFRNCTSLETIDMEDWDKTNLVNISSMFYGCSSLTTIKGVENLISSKIQFGTSIFRGCSSLTEIDVSKWNFRIDDARSMFYGCSSLTKINGVNKLITNKTRYILEFFEGCSSLTEIDVSEWDVSNVYYGNSIFKDCVNLIELDLSNWSVKKFNSMGSLFSGCTNLRNVFMLNCDSESSSSTSNMFNGCSTIKLLDFSNYDFKSTQNINMMIGNCNSLETIIFDNPNLSSLNIGEYGGLSGTLPQLKNIIIKNGAEAYINKLLKIIPFNKSRTDCKVYLSATQDISKIDVATANSKGWQVVQGGYIHNVSKIIHIDDVVFEYDVDMEEKVTSFAPTFGWYCGVKVADVTAEETTMYIEAAAKNGCIITYEKDGVIKEDVSKRTSEYMDGTVGISTSDGKVAAVIAPASWSWYYAHNDQYVKESGVYLVDEQIFDNPNYSHLNLNFRVLKIEILGLDVDKVVRLKQGHFDTDKIKKMYIGEVPNVEYK